LRQIPGTVSNVADRDRPPGVAGARGD